MNKEELIKKLENLDLPEVELPSHQRRLKMALLNSGYWKEKITMNRIKQFAPIGAVAIVAVLVIGVLLVGQQPSSTAYARELVKKSAETLAGSNAVPLPTAVTCTIEDVPKGTSGTTEIKNENCVIQWARPDDSGVVRDEKSNIIFITTEEGKLVPLPREVPKQDRYWAEGLEKAGGYPNAIFNDMAKARNTAYFYIVIKPTSLTNEQIAILRNSGVRMLQLPSQDEITMLKNIGVGISDEKSVYAALIEEDQVEKIKKLDFVVSVTLPQIKAGINEGGVILDDDNSSKGVDYTFTKESFLSFLKEAENAKDLTYLGDKRVGDPSNPLSAIGRTIKILRFTDEKESTVILGIDENKYPVVRLAYTKDGGLMFGSGAINGQTPLRFNLEEAIKYWTENLEQPIDFKAIQK